MENCLVTKLKGSVDNDNLPIYNSIGFILKAGYSLSFSLGNLPFSFKIIVSGDGELKKDNTTSYGKSFEWVSENGDIQYSGPNRIYAYSTDCKVTLTNIKYTFDYIELIGNNGNWVVDPNQFIFNTSTHKERQKHTFSINGARFTNKMNISSIVSYSSMFRVINCYLVSGDDIGNVFDGMLSCVAPKMNINTGGRGLLNASSLIGHSEITKLGVGLLGDIKYLAETSIATDGSVSIYLHAGYSGTQTWTTGSIEGLVEAYIQKGVTSGTLNIEFPSYFGAVTYQETPLSEHTEITSTNKSIVSWDAQGNITWGVKA